MTSNQEYMDSRAEMLRTLTEWECTECHIVKPREAYTKTNQRSRGAHTKCKECVNKKLRAKYATDDKTKEFYQNKRDNSKEYTKEYNTRYRDSNPFNSRQISAYNSAKAFNCEYTATVKDIEAIYDGYCHYCNFKIELKQSPSRKLLNFAELEHKIPFSAGGGHAPDNIVWSCRACNKKKKETLYEDYMKLRRNEVD